MDKCYDLQMNLKSSAGTQGTSVSQIIHFVGGTKKTFHGVLTETIEQGQMTKFKTKDGRLVMVNDVNVLCIEVFSE